MGFYNRAMMRHKGMGTLHWEWRREMGWGEIPEKESYLPDISTGTALLRKKKYVYIYIYLHGTSLVAQWIRIHLPVQETQVRSLLQEDSTCCRATKPMHHNYWACALEPTSHNYWVHMPQLLKPELPEPVLCNKRSHHNERPKHRREE